jgi:hypothetical protein
VATVSLQVPRRARTSLTQSCARFQYSMKVGMKTKDVGSPSSGKIRVLFSALPPIGDR